jgi:hypothetical protein
MKKFGSTSFESYWKSIMRRKEIISLDSFDKDLIKWKTSETYWNKGEQGYSSRFYRVLTMVYNTQNYWVFGLCPSSGFQLIRRKKEKHDDSETGSVSALRWRETPEDGKRSSFRNVVFFFFFLLINWNLNNGQSPKTQ